MNVPEVVDTAMTMKTHIAMLGPDEPVPVAHAEEERSRASRRLLDAELVEDDVEEAARVVQPGRAGAPKYDRSLLITPAGEKRKRKRTMIATELVTDGK